MDGQTGRIEKGRADEGLRIADRDLEVLCYRKLKSAQGVFIPSLLNGDSRAPSLHDDREHALILSWIGPLWGLDWPLSASELLAVQDDVLQMHALGVVHGDLWPRSLVRDRSGKVFIVDFDMALVAPTPCDDRDFARECALERESLWEQIQTLQDDEAKPGGWRLGAQRMV